MKRPLGITLISYFYIFGSVILLLSALFFNVDDGEVGIAARFGILSFPEQLFRIIVAISSLVIITGYLRLKRWGFWLMILYSFIFGIISYILLLSYNQQPFLGNTIWSIIVLIYTFYVRKSFFQVVEDKNQMK